MWGDDAAVADILGRPFRPVEHPDPTTRKRLATQREELVLSLEHERDRVLTKIEKDNANERLAAAASAGLNAQSVAGSTFGTTFGRGPGDGKAVMLSAEGAQVLRRPAKPRRGFAVPSGRSVAPRTNHRQPGPEGNSHDRVHDAQSPDSPVILDSPPDAASEGTCTPLPTSAVDRPTGRVGSVVSPPAMLSVPGLSSPGASDDADGRRRLSSILIPTPSRHGDMSAAFSPGRVPRGGGATAGGVTVSQMHPTSLPDELLQLIRQFRGAVDAVGAASGKPSSEDVKALSLRSAALTRYVTAFIVAREAEKKEEADAKLRGWMRRPRDVFGKDIDPISALIGAASSPATNRRGGGGGAGQSPLESARRSPSDSGPSTSRAGRGRKQSTAFGPTTPRGPSEKFASSATAAGASQQLSTADQAMRVLCSATLLSSHVVLDAACHLVQADRASVFLYDEHTSELCSVAMVGSAAVTRPLRIAPDVGAAGAAFRTGVIINIPNTDKAPPALFSRETGHRTGYYTRSLIACPIRGRRAPGQSGSPVIGVLEVMNKTRPANNNGFTPDDEDLVHKIAAIVGAMLQAAGPDATFSGATALEEGIRAQMVVHSYRDLANANRGRTGPSTLAGSVDLTLTEAKAMQRLQKSQEEKITADITAAGGGKAVRTAGKKKASRGAPAPPAAADNDSGRAGALFDVLTNATALTYPLVYRTHSDAQPSVMGGGGGAEPAKAGGAPSLSAIPSDNVRDLAAFLERVEESWKDTRELCLRHEATIVRLKQARSEEATVKARLLRLCMDAGLLDEAEMAALSAGGANGVADGEEADEDLDEATFHARLSEHHAHIVETHAMRGRRDEARQRLREAAAARPHDVTRRQMQADRAARQLHDAFSAEELGAAPPRRKPLAPETEREQRNREFHERRAAAVRAELRGLVDSHRKEQADLLQRQGDETAAVYRRIMLEDTDAEATLRTLFQEQTGLDPARHRVVREVLARLGGQADDDESLRSM